MHAFQWFFVFYNIVHISLSKYFFENDSDAQLHKMAILQPFGDSLMHNFTENKAGVTFSGIFTNKTVLQREPHIAALYGTCDTLNTSITMSIHNTINQHTEYYSTESNTYNGDWKIILPDAYPNGGNYIITVYCDYCQHNPKNTSIYNITFGDVYFCAGQSNMKLELHFTFNKDYTFNNITQLHKYSNIRFFTKRPFAITDSISPYVIPPQTDIMDGKYQWHESNELFHLNRFSSTCWYTAQSLVDKYNMSDINFGLISSTIGGSKIQSWILNNSITNVCTLNTSITPLSDCGGLYNGMMLPFINMTIKGVLWYQGENNVIEQQMPHNDNILNDTKGYSCLQKLMIEQWRTIWSQAPHTTSPSLPFGVVQLAAGTHEGFKEEMPYFRFSQSGNYGILPNEQLFNVFIAQAYDLGDPWMRGTRHYYPQPYDYNSTMQYMGAIHPRAKSNVGRRLAMGLNKFVYHNDNIWSGPLIKKCKLNRKRGIIRVSFHQDMLYDEEVMVQSLQLWYNESLAETVEYYSAIELLIEGQWNKMAGDIVRVGRDGYSVIVYISDLLENGTEISGIRYAWSDSPCCGDLDLVEHACPMNMCPIITSRSRLPAVPFQAMIVDDKCKCFGAQKCGRNANNVPSLPQIHNRYHSQSTRSAITTTEDTAHYICVMVIEQEPNNVETYDSIAGEYEITDEDMMYWSKAENDQEIKAIFYDPSTGLWNIGSVENMEDNLICDETDIKHPIKCGKWIDSELNVVYDVLLFKGACNRLHIHQLYAKEDASFGFFDSSIKRLVCVILICFCLGAVCTYAVMMKQRRNEMKIEIIDDELPSADIHGLSWNVSLEDH